MSKMQGSTVQKYGRLVVSGASAAHEIVQTKPDRDVLFEVSVNSHVVSERHWHKALELIYITKGTLLMDVDTRTERLDAGDCILINSKVIHSSNGSSGNDSILIQVPMEFLSRYVPDIEHCLFDLDTHNPAPAHQEKLAQLRSVLEEMAAVKDLQPSAANLRFNSLLFELLLELYNNFRIPSAGSSMGVSGNALETLTPVIDYTRDHYMEPITIDMAASLAHLQRSYFCRKFKSLMGQTYLAYLNDVRLAHVYENLIHTDMKLNLILEKNGFTNYKLFRKLFREKFGCTPGEFRRGTSPDLPAGAAPESHSRIRAQKFQDAAADDQERESGPVFSIREV